MLVHGLTSNFNFVTCHRSISEIDAPVSKRTLVVSSPLVTERAWGLGFIRRLYAGVESGSTDAFRLVYSARLTLAVVLVKAYGSRPLLLPKQDCLMTYGSVVLLGNLLGWLRDIRLGFRAIVITVTGQ